MDKAFEMDQAKRAAEAIQKLFGKFVFGCGDDWPICYRCKVPMCQVIKKDETTYFICFETPNGRLCGHREYGV